MIRRLAFVGLVALMGCGLVAAAEDKKAKKGAVFNTSQVLLEVSGPIILTVITGEQKVLATAQLPTEGYTVKGDSKNETSGETTLTTNTLTITYTEPITLNNSSSDKLSNVKVMIETTLYQNTSYWKISDMTVSYNGKYQATDESLWVDQVKGYLMAGPWNCARGFTSCAPVTLSWTCDGQMFSGKALTEKTAQGTVLTFPGMELQPSPFYRGANKIRFGFNWDCDPLIPSALWVTLLLGLALIVALYWSCDMITSLTTPDRFDDVKKTKPIMVDKTE